MAFLQRCKTAWNDFRNGPPVLAYQTTAISEPEESDSTSGEDYHDEISPPTQWTTSVSTPPATISNWLWPDIIAPCAFLISLAVHTVMRSKLDAACTALTETWSPLTHLVEYEWRQFDFEACHPEFCGGYEENREKAWEKSWDLGWYTFPRSQEALLHHPPDQVDWLHLLQDENALIAMPGVIHQLHCLSLVREAIHRDEFPDRDTSDFAKARFDWHVNHCIFAIDVLVRCKADISPVVLEEVDEADGVQLLSKFRLRDPVKRCRKYEPLRSC
ncbi:hypothetical protein QBC35DRAFT_536435 [Podospora australis]|uniref:Cyclochlorotine biosynthesis protein O n=1 Tax=Podospora australis TaxID=1536484 RepID=A0AAN6WJN2_9PEZI|nr:hypothetical protein QBC35DRAFT_536435 [Podospora australis]